MIEPVMLGWAGADDLAMNRGAAMAGCTCWTSKVTTEALRMAELGHIADA